MIPSLAAEFDAQVKEKIAAYTNNAERAINDFIAPLYTGDCFGAGSTDVGDVSWQTPTAQVHTATFTSCAPGHSWQNVSLGKSSIGHKGMLLAAKVLAAATVELFETPALVEEAKEEFKSRSKSGYVCPIPENEYAKAVEI